MTGIEFSYTEPAPHHKELLSNIILILHMGMDGERKYFVFVYFVMAALTAAVLEDTLSFCNCKPFGLEKVAGLAGVFSDSSNNGSMGLKMKTGEVSLFRPAH